MSKPLNAFCVDLEEWFHVCGVKTPYTDPTTWDDAPSHVVNDTGVLIDLLEEAGAQGTFLTVGWVAEKYPDLIRRLVDGGHEIGCHTYYHNLVFKQKPEEFEADIARCLEVLRDISGQEVTCFRAPGFSITKEAFWAYPILRRHGIKTDVSIVPAQRDHGGVPGFSRDPFRLNMDEGSINCFPVSVMDLLGRRVPFSGGGYLRLFPKWLINRGFRQNHRDGRPGMLYIHPREINPDQPRLDLPRAKYFKYYVNLKTTRDKLRSLLACHDFTTISNVMKQAGPLQTTMDLADEFQ